VDHKGWAIKPVAMTDQPAIESVRERNDELRAACKADMEREPHLHNVVAADCLHAVKGAYSTLDQPATTPGERRGWDSNPRGT
jgi:hypothetical protein